jgi:uncharacterized protein (TIGR00299 family) protein
MKCLYIDTSNSGLSGDMFLASLLGFTANPDEIIKDLEQMKEYLDGVSKLELVLKKKEVNGIQINQLEVEIKEDKSNRTPKAMLNFLEYFIKKNPRFELSKEYATSVLRTMIQAEANVHGKKMDEIHLHELSSVDTLIDILGVSVCLNEIGIFSNNTRIYCSFLPLGAGTVKTAHGMLPVPAPATLKILEGSNIITYGGPIESELVTPTGAALLLNLNPISVDFMPKMNIKKVSYSTGQKNFEHFSNTLRLFYGESKSSQNEELLGHFEPYLEDVSVIETNIDDVSGELIGHFINSLEKNKFLDIQVISSLTKKNRPSYVIKLLCHPKDTFDLINKIVNELGTLGVRYNVTKRICVERKFETVNLEINQKMFQIKFKIAFIRVKNKVKILNVKPEYEDLNKISKKTGLTVKQIMIHCQSLIKNLYNPLE